jgi:SAM-dependent methyltransferase
MSDVSAAFQPWSQRRLELVDRALDAAAADAMRHHDRLRGLTVDVRFDRCVAHLTGDVDDLGQERLVRQVLGRLSGVLAVWSRVRVDNRAPVVVDLGCGATKQYPGNIGVDVLRTPGADVVADVSRGLPFADASVDLVFAVHVMEHLTNFLPLLDECHRVLRPGGVLHVLAPWWRYVNAVADPTHVRLLDIQTIKGLCTRPGSGRRWYPLHAACDGASVFADLTPLAPGEADPDEAHLARFFN